MLLGLDNGGKTSNIAWYFVVLICIAALSVFLSKETRSKSRQTAQRSVKGATSNTSVPPTGTRPHWAGAGVVNLMRTSSP